MFDPVFTKLEVSNHPVYHTSRSSLRQFGLLLASLLDKRHLHLSEALEFLVELENLVGSGKPVGEHAVDLEPVVGPLGHFGDDLAEP